MKLSPDQTIYWQHGFITINLTLVTTWGVMLVLVLAAALVTRKLKTGIHISRFQALPLQHVYCFRFLPVA